MNRPRPVLTRSAIAAAVTSVASLAAWLGYADVAHNLSAQASGIGSVVVTVLALLPHAAVTLSAEKVVTPVSDPRDNNGTALLAPVTDDIAASVGTGSADDIRASQ